MLLDVRNLTITGQSEHGPVDVVDRVSFSVAEGEVHSLVGESGSGKSLIASAIMGFLDPRWQVRADRLWFDGKDLLSMSKQQRRKIIGVDIAMIFQDPRSYLDPNDTIEAQLAEAILTEDLDAKHWWSRRSERRQKVIQLLHRVGIKEHQQVMESFPFEISEGVAQKVMIASAIAHRPRLLIADEPTTAMEPATRAQIYRLLGRFHASHKMSILLMSQDMGTIMPESQRLTMLYSGQIMESGPTEALLKEPFHPYTKAITSTSLYQQSQCQPKTHLPTLPGASPPMQHLPIGCRLGPRCPNARRQCVVTPSIQKFRAHVYACHYPLNSAGKEQGLKRSDIVRAEVDSDTEQEHDND
ncbi:oligopeptide/dipeptide ABC transporter ATP-binding protein [Aliidiomarina maris]|uniref:Cationic peptide transport system ATP-binding protein n=1 Tax=Aliidiomarina maris TaxID=531312 RepID=A0A327XB60_9GAMM|nr:oligopeptide/dipeptide ABC transporter ATP-binding protein [Aliidiomarina maris]MBA3987733.1 peptide ABC transporter ATP-binding protein [Idiomarina sp.]RAK01456.1 cationic peptide transport system ATP-binding protein [Aliidiomarina maris]RUO28293.1 peptide ABC transporter ATP-binding protein [Aliidiomarina maris]